MTENPAGTKEERNPRLRVAIIARDESGRVLLLQHLRPRGKYWVLPGGGVDAGESIESALVREVKEELGVDCRIEKLVAVGELITPERHVVDFFLEGKIGKSEPLTIATGEGIIEARWMTHEEMKEILLLPREVLPFLLKGPGSFTGVTYLGKYKIRGRDLDKNPGESE